jgi:hypothetical protein
VKEASCYPSSATAAMLVPAVLHYHGRDDGSFTLVSFHVAIHFQSNHV